MTFPLPDGRQAQAVKALSLDVRAGEILAVVGESGCGKTVATRCLLRLLPPPPACVVTGRALLSDGRDLLRLAGEELRRVRGGLIGMAFQDSLASLNPVRGIGRQIEEVIQAHRGLSRGQARAEAGQMLAALGLPDSERQLAAYPFELSGGMRQRVVLAAALAGEPRLLVADEPTSALDVTVQAQVLALLREWQKKDGRALWLVTHDLAVATELADRLAVMYAGLLVELGPQNLLLRAPAHPYTSFLAAAARWTEPAGGAAGTLPVLPGRVPQPWEFFSGCPFAPRCAYARDNCRERLPELVELRRDHLVRCLYPLSGEAGEAP